MKKSEIIKLVSEYLLKKYNHELSHHETGEWRESFKFEVLLKDPNIEVETFSESASGSIVNYDNDLQIITDGSISRHSESCLLKERGAWSNESCEAERVVTNATITIKKLYKSSSIYRYTAQSIEIYVSNKKDFNFFNNLNFEIKIKVSKNIKKEKKEFFNSKFNEAVKIAGKNIAEYLLNENICSIGRLSEFAKAYTTIRIESVPSFDVTTLRTWKEFDKLGIAANLNNMQLWQCLALVDLKIRNLSEKEKLEILKSKFKVTKLNKAKVIKMITNNALNLINIAV